MKFDFTFNISNLIEMVVMLGTLWGFHTKNVARIKAQEVAQEARMSKQEERLETLFKWFQDNIVNRPIVAIGSDVTGQLAHELAAMQREIAKLAAAATVRSEDDN